MRGWRTIGLVATWAVLTSASTALVWYGLRPVRDAAVPQRVQTLTQAELRRMADEPDATPSSGPSPRPTASPSRTAAAAASAAPIRPSTEPSRRQGGDAPVYDGWRRVSEDDGTYSYVRRFEVEGGQTTIRAMPGEITLGSATPNPGYSVDVEQTGPERLVVRFISRSQVILLDAIWWEGRPFVTVTPLGG